MNPSITFPPGEPALKLSRPSAEKWAAGLAEERRRLNEDQEALREREQNLRDYEARLRSLQTEIDAGRNNGYGAGPALRAVAPGLSWTPPVRAAADDHDLQVGWEKLHRAREILEAEQRNLRDERISLREMDAQMKVREDAVKAREHRVAEREALVVAATTPAPTPEPVASEREPATSAMSRLTRGPFDIARTVFGGKK